MAVDIIAHLDLSKGMAVVQEFTVHCPAPWIVNRGIWGDIEVAIETVGTLLL